MQHRTQPPDLMRDRFPDPSLAVKRASQFVSLPAVPITKEAILGKSSTCRILGLDPGLRTAGYAFIDAKDTWIQLIQPLLPCTFACGVITTPDAWPPERRLQHLYGQVREMVTLYRPDIAAVETFFFAKNPRTALQVGQARGVIILALAEEGIPIAEYDPQTVKRILTGERYAPKHLVGTNVRDLLHLPTVPHPDDAADAAAIAICHYKLGITTKPGVFPSHNSSRKGE